MANSNYMNKLVSLLYYVVCTLINLTAFDGNVMQCNNEHFFF